ncbi:MAG: hypothetical protein SYC29_03415 [Planctomycetota bacterium]|nr:hypothetical protein [Planctomycetota bacterium]
MNRQPWKCSLGWGLSVCAALVLSGAAGAEYASDFEGLDASPAGTLLTGQDAYYLPPDTDSVDWYAYTYDGNVLQIVDNPCGGAQFVGGTGPGDGTFYARAQRDSEWGGGVWMVTYDVTGQYLGAPPSADNIGSFSAQPFPGSASYIQLLNWTDPDTAEEWNARYIPYDAGGTQFAPPYASAGPEWEGLPINHWYRIRTWIDFDLNRITQVSLTDLATGETFTAQPDGWYLEGGEAGGFPTPTGFRFFAGSGTVEGNSAVFDNIIIAPPCPGDLDGDGTVNTADLLSLLASWGTPCGDVDGNGDTNTADLLDLLANWGDCP